MTSTLEAIIRRLIERHGPITIAEYMALALGHPDHGYYQTRDPFGRGGDFTTAPEISQMFGELIGAWGIGEWQRLGQPAFHLVEFGPGRGTLMRDLLRIAARIAPNFVRAMSLHLVETSAVLRDVQAGLLGGYAPTWHEGIEDVPEGPAIYLMNEFLDALPVRQFVVTEAGLCERRVGLVEDRFAFVVERNAIPFPHGRGREAYGAAISRTGEGVSQPQSLPQPTPSPDTLSHSAKGIASPMKERQIVETCPAALAITRAIASRIVQHGGAALIVDYGYDAPAGEDTFQAVRNHAYADPLTNPGEADLTAHVDFAAVAEAARQEGVIVSGPMGQGAFLTNLGIQHRARKLSEGGDAGVEAALHRLTDPDQMGTLFKVLILST